MNYSVKYTSCCCVNLFKIYDICLLVTSINICVTIHNYVYNSTHSIIIFGQICTTVFLVVTCGLVPVE